MPVTPEDKELGLKCSQLRLVARALGTQSMVTLCCSLWKDELTRTPRASLPPQARHPHPQAQVPEGDPGRGKVSSDAGRMAGLDHRLGS